MRAKRAVRQAVVVLAGLLAVQAKSAYVIENAVREVGTA